MILIYRKLAVDLIHSSTLTKFRKLRLKDEDARVGHKTADSSFFDYKIHMAIRKARQGSKGQNTNQVTTYYFDVNKCKCCSLRNGCYKEGSKSKTYSVSIKSDAHKNQAIYQETKYFKERARKRYMIEAKNSELKHQHGYDVALSSGLLSMQMQGA